MEKTKKKLKKPMEKTRQFQVFIQIEANGIRSWHLNASGFDLPFLVLDSRQQRWHHAVLNVRGPRSQVVSTLLKKKKKTTHGTISI